MAAFCLLDKGKGEVRCRTRISIPRSIRSRAALPDAVRVAVKENCSTAFESCPRCNACGLDYSFADSGDGPAAFVILIIGFIVVGLALWMEVNVGPRSGYISSFGYRLRLF